MGTRGFCMPREKAPVFNASGPTAVQAPACGKPSDDHRRGDHLRVQDGLLTVGPQRSVVNSCMTPQQETAEREIIFAMMMMLRNLRDAGHNDWQTLTSFLANLLMDQDNPPRMLKRLAADVKLKLSMMRQMPTTH